jgi:hypothetical protein
MSDLGAHFLLPNLEITRAEPCSLSYKQCMVTTAACDGTVLRHYWCNVDLHRVTRLMKRQAVEDLLVMLVGRAHGMTGMSDVSAYFSLCTSQEPPLS